MLRIRRGYADKSGFMDQAHVASQDQPIGFPGLALFQDGFIHGQFRWIIGPFDQKDLDAQSLRFGDDRSVGDIAHQSAQFDMQSSLRNGARNRFNVGTGTGSKQHQGDHWITIPGVSMTFPMR
jgi:hypothetical protein